jgi:hypothetical protein
MTTPDTDSEAQLHALTRRLFGKDREQDVDLGQPQPKNTNHVPSEGANPDPPPITPEAVMRDFVRRMFDPDYAFYEQHLPE